MTQVRNEQKIAKTIALLLSRLLNCQLFEKFRF